MKKNRMTKEMLLKRLAQLESVNDHLYAEVSYTDQLMQLIGFHEGLKSVKHAAEELIKTNPTELYEY